MQGSRKHRSTMDVLFKKTLSFDLCRQQRTNMALFDNDAGSCYDRILGNLAMLCARRLGVPSEAVFVHSETLRLMKYTVKTDYGTSAGHYSSTATEPLAGTGQGSGASPAVWLSICAALLLAYKTHVPKGITFSDPTETMISSRRYADAFVDDTSIGFNDPNNLMNVPSLIRTLTECAQLCWENLFFSTGGALELSKCYYHHIFHWQWDVLGYPKITTLNPHLTDPGEYSSSTDTFNSLKLISGRETHYTKIHHKAPHISSKSLGVISCPLGTWDDEFRRLATKSNIHATTTTMSNQVRNMDAHQAHRTIWASQMGYSL